MILVINEDDCNGEARQFEAFMRQAHPDIQVDFHERTSGVGGGLFDDDGFELDSPDLWAEYCNQPAPQRDKRMVEFVRGVKVIPVGGIGYAWPYVVRRQR